MLRVKDLPTSGILYVVGPARSGKSSAIRTVIKEANQEGLHPVHIEFPAEFCDDASLKIFFEHTVVPSLGGRNPVIIEARVSVARKLEDLLDGKSPGRASLAARLGLKKRTPPYTLPTIDPASVKSLDFRIDRDSALAIARSALLERQSTLAGDDPALTKCQSVTKEELDAVIDCALVRSAVSGETFLPGLIPLAIKEGIEGSGTFPVAASKWKQKIKVAEGALLPRSQTLIGATGAAIDALRDEFASKIAPAVAKIGGFLAQGALGPFGGVLTLLAFDGGNEDWVETFSKLNRSWDILPDDFRQFASEAYDLRTLAIPGRTYASLARLLGPPVSGSASRDEVEKTIREAQRTFGDNLSQLASEISRLEDAVNYQKGLISSPRQLGLLGRGSGWELSDYLLGSTVELVTDRALDELAEKVDRALDEARVVFIRGPKGMGKSVLARYVVASRILGGEQVFSFGVGKELPQELQSTRSNPDSDSPRYSILFDPSIPETYSEANLSTGPTSVYDRGWLDTLILGLNTIVALNKATGIPSLIVLPDDVFAAMPPPGRGGSQNDGPTNDAIVVFSIAAQSDDFLERVIRAYCGSITGMDAEIRRAASMAVRLPGASLLVAKYAGLAIGASAREGGIEIDRVVSAIETIGRFFNLYLQYVVLRNDHGLVQKAAAPILVRWTLGVLPEELCRRMPEIVGQAPLDGLRSRWISQSKEELLESTYRSLARQCLSEPVEPGPVELLQKAMADAARVMGLEPAAGVRASADYLPPGIGGVTRAVQAFVISCLRAPFPTEEQSELGYAYAVSTLNISGREILATVQGTRVRELLLAGNELPPSSRTILLGIPGIVPSLPSQLAVDPVYFRSRLGEIYTRYQKSPTMSSRDFADTISAISLSRAEPKTPELAAMLSLLSLTIYAMAGVARRVHANVGACILTSGTAALKNDPSKQLVHAVAQYTTILAGASQRWIFDHRLYGIKEFWEAVETLARLILDPSAPRRESVDLAAAVAFASTMCELSTRIGKANIEEDPLGMAIDIARSIRSYGEFEALVADAEIGLHAGESMLYKGMGSRVARPWIRKGSLAVRRFVDLGPTRQVADYLAARNDTAGDVSVDLPRWDAHMTAYAHWVIGMLEFEDFDFEKANSFYRKAASEFLSLGKESSSLRAVNFADRALVITSGLGVPHRFREVWRNFSDSILVEPTTTYYTLARFAASCSRDEALALLKEREAEFATLPDVLALVRCLVAIRTLNVKESRPEVLRALDHLVRAVSPEFSEPAILFAEGVVSKRKATELAADVDDALRALSVLDAVELRGPIAIEPPQKSEDFRELSGRMSPREFVPTLILGSQERTCVSLVFLAMCQLEEEGSRDLLLACERAYPGTFLAVTARSLRDHYLSAGASCRCNKCIQSAVSLFYFYV